MTTTKRVLDPGPGHPITIAPSPRRVTVLVAGKTIADTRQALVLSEGSYSPVVYVPREDAAMDLLERSTHSTYCPYKGDASYYSIPAGGDRSVNAVWTYENPHAAVGEIKDYLAFYPDRIDTISSVE